jgi:hypothetical protein
MAGKSTYLEDQVLNYMKGTTFVAPTTNVYVALFTTAPADDGSGYVEVSGGSYARVLMARSTAWSAITGGTSPHQISNNGVLTFPTPTVSWGTVLAVGIFDLVTLNSGNLLYWNTITSQAIGIGVVASFAIGALVITED